MTKESELSATTLAEEEMDSAESFTFPPAERKVVTQSYDLSIQTLMEQWTGNLLIIPEIQREYIWDDGRASRLIESLLLNIPVPVLYFAETQDAKYEIIDGQQRVRSIVRFISNEFPLISLNVLNDYHGFRFHQLPDREQRFLKMRMVRAVIISNESHPSMKFEIFERLNSGSMSLNPQELRNSIYRGSFNRLLRELVKDPVFRTIIGTKHPRPRMLDEELLLRFFALAKNYANYRPPDERTNSAFLWRPKLWLWSRQAQSGTISHNHLLAWMKSPKAKILLECFAIGELTTFFRRSQPPLTLDRIWFCGSLSLWTNEIILPMAM